MKEEESKMKKVLSLVVATAALTIATGAMASIINTSHDLSSVAPQNTYKSNTSQVCVFCHTPHNSTVTRALWNRNNPTTTFSLYTSGANLENANWYVGSDKTQLPASSPSLLCLSCHDGTTLLGGAVAAKPSDAPTITFAANPTGKIASGASLGNNLTNDHPISLVYDTVRAAIPTTLNASSGGAVNGLPLAKGQNLECNTCHNVHDNTYAPFLRMSNEQSALCRACHIK